MNRSFLSIVIPCYNSEKSINIVHKEVVKTLKGYQYEIILVNDGSKDDTWNVISGLAKKDKNTIAINLSRNFGQHSAIMAGFKHSKGDIIVGLDDDGENNPQDIPKLLEKLEEGYDCVCASYDSHTSATRKLGTKLNDWMACQMIGKPKNITLTSLYAVKRFVVDQVNKYDNPYPYIAGLFLQATKNWGTVQLKKSERLYGKSGYSLKKLFSLWMNGFTAFSIKPLRVASYLGIFMGACGFIGVIILIIKKIINSNIMIGYTSIASLLLLIGGVILFVLGVIGEYIGRIYLSLNNSPQFVIKEIEGKGEDK